MAVTHSQLAEAHEYSQLFFNTTCLAEIPADEATLEGILLKLIVERDDALVGAVSPEMRVVGRHRESEGIALVPQDQTESALCTQ